VSNYQLNTTGELVTAKQFTGNFEAIEEFVGGDATNHGGGILVATKQGALTAEDRGWIIKQGSGEFSSMTDYQFRRCFSRA